HIEKRADAGQNYGGSEMEVKDLRAVDLVIGIAGSILDAQSSEIRRQVVPHVDRGTRNGGGSSSGDCNRSAKCLGGCNEVGRARAEAVGAIGGKAFRGIIDRTQPAKRGANDAISAVSSIEFGGKRRGRRGQARNDAC